MALNKTLIQIIPAAPGWRFVRCEHLADRTTWDLYPLVAFAIVEYDDPDGSREISAIGLEATDYVEALDYFDEDVDDEQFLCYLAPGASPNYALYDDMVERRRAEWEARRAKKAAASGN